MSDDDERESAGAKLFVAIVVGGTAVALGGLIWWSVHKSARAREPFDAEAYLARGEAEVRERDGSARLQQIEVERVDPDGRVHTEHGGQLRATWVTPALVTDGDQPVMLGAPHRGGGQGHTMWMSVTLYEDEGASLDYRMDVNACSSSCGPAVAGPRGCTIPELWQRAIDRGAPHPALADLRLLTADRAGTAVRTWQFSITDRLVDGPSREVFAVELPDACR